MRPDRFGRVLSFLGSFAQMPGGNPYSELILQTEPKPRRVFLQAATRDLGWDHAGAILPDALRWLFRDGPQASLGSR